MFNMAKKPLQQGVEEPGYTELGAAAVYEQMAEIRDKSDKEKIPLTKEVEEYTRANLRRVQEKLAAGEPVYPADMEFIGKVKYWMTLEPDWRMKLPSIEEMERIPEMVDARNRSLTIRQWQDLFHMASFKEEFWKCKAWIDRAFKFPGDGRIVAEGLLRFDNDSGLKRLPANLEVRGDLMLDGCTGLTSIPDNLYVRGSLRLYACTGIKSLPDSLNVGSHLFLSHCTGLASLPAKMKINGCLHLEGCRRLTSLPDDLMVREDVTISDDAPERVKRDAERLKKEGKIGGIIEYLY